MNYKLKTFGHCCYFLGTYNTGEKFLKTKGYTDFVSYQNDPSTDPMLDLFVEE